MKAGILEVVKNNPKIETPTKRESNIELLRIIATVFIFVYHYMVHGAISEVYIYTTNKIVALFLSTEGQVGVNIFFMITGYFMIKSKFKIRKVLKFSFQILFYSVLMLFLELRGSEYNLAEFTYFFEPITNNIYWFATVYVFIYVITPFLNAMIKGIGKKGCEVFLILFGIFLSILPMFFNKFFAYSELRWGIYMYVLGAYISLYSIKFKNKKTGLIISILHPICVFLIEVVIIFFDRRLGLEINKDKCICMYSIFSVTGAMGFFLYFKSLKINYNKIINYISKISFATFLISGHQKYHRRFWFLDCKTDLVINSPVYIFLFHTFLCTVAIYVIAGIVEFLRVNLLEKPIFKILKIKSIDMALNRLENWMNLTKI